MSAWVYAIGCGLGVAILLLAEARDNRTAKAIAKSAASLCFVLFAVAMGATGSLYGQAVLAGLALCAIGDVLLLSGKDRLFLAGMGAFGLGHAAYAAAFFSLGLGVNLAVIGAAAAMAYFAWRIVRWLGPHLGAFRGPVALYTAVISLMVVASISAGGVAADWRIATGALAFAASDIAVARDRFVKSEFLNRSWGLPLYYGAQLLLASTV